MIKKQVYFMKGRPCKEAFRVGKAGHHTEQPKGMVVVLPIRKPSTGKAKWHSKQNKLCRKYHEPQ